MVHDDRLMIRRKKLAALRAKAASGDVAVRSREEIIAACDWSIPESADVRRWIDELPVGRELA